MLGTGLVITEDWNLGMVLKVCFGRGLESRNCGNLAGNRSINREDLEHEGYKYINKKIIQNLHIFKPEDDFLTGPR